MPASRTTTHNKNEFQWVIWTIFALENWILDFGRPIAMVNYHSISNYNHVLIS
jgi:hypothetical protein